MLYAFSKSKRFNTIQSNCSGDYTIPTTATKRSTSFGYGSKNHLSSSALSIPGPNHYRVDMESSSFRKSKTKGITFGSSREVRMRIILRSWSITLSLTIQASLFLVQESIAPEKWIKSPWNIVSERNTRLLIVKKTFLVLLTIRFPK